MRSTSSRYPVPAVPSVPSVPLVPYLAPVFSSPSTPGSYGTLNTQNLQYLCTPGTNSISRTPGTPQFKKKNRKLYFILTVSLARKTYFVKGWSQTLVFDFRDILEGDFAVVFTFSFDSVSIFAL